MFRYDYDLKRWIQFERKITYTQRHEYYTDDDVIPEGLSDVIVDEIVLNDEQRMRLEHVRYIEDMGIDALTKYVMFGEFTEDYPKIGIKVAEEKTIETLLSMVDFATATPAKILGLSPLANPWNGSEIFYTAGQLITDDEVMYRVLISHTSQMDWKPKLSPSLFAVLLTSPTGEPLDWVQPDSTNPYNIGDKVKWTDGFIYESLINGNVWSPSAYPQGWKKL